MHEILFTVSGFNFYTHGVVAVLGIILGSIVTYFLAKRKALNTEMFFDNIVFSTLFGIIGARITYFVIYRDQFASFRQIFELWDGGLVSYGGFFLGGLTFWLLLKKQRELVSSWFDVASIGFFLGLSLGRIGDLFAGEYNGVESSMSIPAIGAYNIVPVAFFEAILCLVIFILTYIFYRVYDKKLVPSVIALMSISMYSLGRFILDFWRTELKVYASLSIGQLVSAVLFILTIILYVRLLVRNRSVYEAK